MRNVGKKLELRFVLLVACCFLGSSTRSQGQGIMLHGGFSSASIVLSSFPVGCAVVMTSSTGYLAPSPLGNVVSGYVNFISEVSYTGTMIPPVSVFTGVIPGSLITLHLQDVPSPPAPLPFDAETSVVLMEVNRTINADRISEGGFPPLPPTPLSTVAVPEPGTGLLVGMGGLALGLIGFLRRQRILRDTA